MSTKTKFRVTKCIDTDGIVKEFAIVNGKRCLIKSDKNDNKYFYIKNPKTEKGLWEIKDAIEAIRAGYGDALLIKNSLITGMFHLVTVFLDKEVGEEYRSKCIEGFKSSKFGYCLRIEFKDNLEPGRKLGKNDLPITIFDDQLSYRCFETETAAHKHLNSLIEKAKEYCDKIVETQDIEIFDEVEIKYSQCHAITEMVFDLVWQTEDKKFEYVNADKSFDHIRWKVEQCIIPKNYNDEEGEDNNG